MAKINDVLFDYYQIKVIGYDIVFAEEDIDEGTKLLEKMANGALQNNAAFIEEYQSVMSSLQHDMRFAETLKNRKTIMGFVMDTDTIKGSLPPATTKLDDNNLGQLQLNKPTGYTENIELLQKSAYGGVFDNPLLDDSVAFPYCRSMETSCIGTRDLQDLSGSYHVLP